MNLLRTFTTTALAGASLAGGLAVATASPAHAALPTRIIRYNRDVTMWLQAEGKYCVRSSPEEMAMDAALGTTVATPRLRSFSCTLSGTTVRVSYRVENLFFWDYWSEDRHHALVNIVKGGRQYYCGDIYTRSPVIGYFRNTSPRYYAEIGTQGVGHLTCTDGTPVIVSFGSFDDFEAR